MTPDDERWMRRALDEARRVQAVAAAQVAEALVPYWVC